LIPSHLPDEYGQGEDPLYDNSQYNILQRARFFAKNLRLISVPSTLLKITQMQEQLKYLQLYRGGFPISPHTVAKKLGIENFGEIPGVTEFEKWTNWKQLELLIQGENDGDGRATWDDALKDRTVFFNWAMGNGYSPELQIDRKDNNGPYSPENCRWVTSAENCRNRRDNRITPEQAGEIKRLLIEGYSITVIGKHYGVDFRLISTIRTGLTWKGIPPAASVKNYPARKNSRTGIRRTKCQMAKTWY
jgi:hypothetical protein